MSNMESQKNICAYGCGKPGIKQFKNGNWCCCENVNRCEAKCRRDSERKAGINPLEKWGIPHPKGATGKAPWNKGKKYEELYGEDGAKEVKRKIVTSVGKERYKTTWDRLSEENKQKQRERCAKVGAKTGGYKKGSGRGLSGWYQGIWCDSSWELAFLIYHLEHDIKIKRSKLVFPYIWEGNTYNYHPDFEVNEIVYEIKGYMTEKALQKVKQAPIAISVIDKELIKPYLNYTIRKYGKKFTYLYETNSSK